MLPRSCYDYSTTITDHRLVLSIRSDYDGTGLYDMLSVRRHTYAGACFFFSFFSFFADSSSSLSSMALFRSIQPLV